MQPRNASDIDEEEWPLFCSHCGKEYEEDSIYCESCGMNLAEEGINEPLELAHPAELATQAIPITPVQENHAAHETNSPSAYPPKETMKWPIIVAAVTTITVVAVVTIVLTVGMAEQPWGNTTEQTETTDNSSETEQLAETPSEPVKKAAEHLIVFETSGGSVYDQIKASDGAVVTTPPEPTRAGYVFGGWYSDASCTAPFSFPYEITSKDSETICIYAKWTEEASELSDYEYTSIYPEDEMGAPDYRHVYSDCLFPQSSSEYLGYTDMVGLTPDEVQRAINEIFARNGYIFQSSETERAYFESQPWYVGTETDPDAVSSWFNEYERENMKLFQDYRASL